MSVENGTVTLTGQESLTGLSVTLVPQWSSSSGVSGWQRTCDVQNDATFQQACEDVFRFDYQ